jgi:hypothetical protein
MKDLLIGLGITIGFIILVAALLVIAGITFEKNLCNNLTELNQNPDIRYEWRMTGGCLVILPDGTVTDRTKLIYIGE